MKKITSREFQQRFGRVQSRLRGGEKLEVTYRGKVIGTFTKAGKTRIKTPDFLTNLKGAGYPVELGNQILREFNESLS